MGMFSASAKGGSTPLASSLLTKVQSYNKFAT